MENITDPILAHHVRAIKAIRDSLFPHPLSDCCRSSIVDINDLEVCTCCLQHCSPTPA